MTETEAARVVGQIVAQPSREAFDTASGAIVRLFARVIAIETRLTKLEQLPRARPRRRKSVVLNLDGTPRGPGRPPGARNQPKPETSPEAELVPVDEFLQRQEQQQQRPQV